MIEKPRRISTIVYLSVLAIIAIVINLISGFSLLVENQYAVGFYPGFSQVLRAVTGWFPVSLGDLLYLSFIVWLLWRSFKVVRRMYRKEVTFVSVRQAFIKLLIISLSVYVIFNIFWGLNYNRKGITWQLGIETGSDTAGLKIVYTLLLDKVNESKSALLKNGKSYPRNREIFKRAQKVYEAAQKNYPFLGYKNLAVKSSIFGWLGNYLGFIGYYNPFTGEAQVNTTVPRFIIPFTTCHEIAHQIGYAKEDEANFVGYLAAVSSNDTLFHYSTYLDLFTYARGRIYQIDSVFSKQISSQLLPEVKADLLEYRKFMLRHKNPLEPVVRWMYGNYLKANQQPRGLSSYNDVISRLVGYYRKFGKI